MQAYISKSLEGLDFKTRYGLSDYTDSSEPLIIFGMYREEDFQVWCNHLGEVSVVWQGMDAKATPEQWVNSFKRDVWADTRTKHYSISHWIKQSLDAYGIENELLPIPAAFNIPNPVPRGNFIYAYSSSDSKADMEYYGLDLLPEITRRTNLYVFHSWHGRFSKEYMQSIYRASFINLRLTTYDGCPNTNIEMGLMGRRSIFNGNIPHSIPFKGVDDICESIMREYENRHEDNTQIATDISEYLNIKFP